MKREPLKLFVIKDYRGNEVTDPNTGEVLYFDDKMEAKANKPDASCTVAPGPDHRRFNG